MNRRYLRRRYRRNRHPARPCRQRPGPGPERLEERVQARARELFGAPLEEVAPDPLLRQVVQNAIAAGLRQPVRLIPADVLEMADRLREDGIVITPSACDPRDLPVPRNLGISLSDAVLEERYGSI